MQPRNLSYLSALEEGNKMTEEKKNIGEDIGNSMSIAGMIFIFISLGLVLWEITPYLLNSNMPIFFKILGVGTALFFIGLLISSISNKSIGIVNE
jgi:hypothetical protein